MSEQIKELIQVRISNGHKTKFYCALLLRVPLKASLGKWVFFTSVFFIRLPGFCWLYAIWQGWQETIGPVCNSLCFWSRFLAKIAALSTCTALFIFKAFHRADVNSQSSTDFGGKSLVAFRKGLCICMESRNISCCSASSNSIKVSSFKLGNVISWMRFSNFPCDQPAYSWL